MDTLLNCSIDTVGGCIPKFGATEQESIAAALEVAEHVDAGLSYAESIKKATEKIRGSEIKTSSALPSKINNNTGYRRLLQNSFQMVFQKVAHCKQH